MTKVLDFCLNVFKTLEARLKCSVHVLSISEVNM